MADTAKDTPPTPATASGKEDVMSHKDYDLPIHSKNVLPDDYERYDDDDEKDEKVTQRTLHPRPLLPPGRIWYFPEAVAGVGGVSLAVSANADVRDLLADFFLNRPWLSSTLHPPMAGTIRPKTNAEAYGISFLM